MGFDVATFDKILDAGFGVAWVMLTMKKEYDPDNHPFLSGSRAPWTHNYIRGVLEGRGETPWNYDEHVECIYC